MFGGSAIEKKLFDKIREILPDGKTILEFGSGEGTAELLKHYRVISVEHNIKYVKQRSQSHRCLTAFLHNGWYDPGVVKTVLKDKFDLILIDGPVGRDRGNITDHYALFADVDCPVIFDDVNRKIDYEAMSAFCMYLGYDFKIVKGERKDFAICIKQ